MVSFVNPDIVVDGVDISKTEFKAQLATMRDEISALQARIAAATTRLQECCGGTSDIIITVDDGILIETTGSSLGFAPSTGSFGSVVVGVPSSTLAIVITSTGSDPVIVDSISITGTAAADYTIVSIGVV